MINSIYSTEGNNYTCPSNDTIDLLYPELVAAPKKPEPATIERIWNMNSPDLKADLMQELFERMDLGDLLDARGVQRFSQPLANRVLSKKAKEVFPELASVAGPISPSALSARIQRVHKLVEACDCSLVLFQKEKKNPTFLGTSQLEEYLERRNTLVVWRKLADAIGVNTKPDLSNLTSIADFRNEASKFSNWFNTNIAQLTSLERLSLKESNLTSLPPEIGDLTNLRGLLLQDNNLDSLPSELSQLSSLELLNLTNNSFTSFPPEICNLFNLLELYLGYNNLISLPPEIDQLTNLKWLVLRKNNLTSLPPEIGNLTNLRGFFVERNNLSFLPPEIGQLISVTECYVDRNQLIDLPPEFGQLRPGSTSILGNPLDWQTWFTYASRNDYVPFMLISLFSLFYVAKFTDYLG